MKPLGAREPPRHGGRRFTLVVVGAVIWLVSLGAGLWLGVSDIAERRRDVVDTTNPVGATTTYSPTDPDNTTVVTDDSGQLTVVIPTAWSDISTNAWDRAGIPVGVQVGAAPDLEAWRAGWATPGIFVGVSDSVTVDEGYGDWSGDCVTRGSDEPFHAAGFEGTLRVWQLCGAEGSTFLVGVAQPADGSLVLVFQAVVISDADRIAADQVIATLGYTP